MQGVHGQRALQRQQRHLGHRDDFAAAADFVLDMRDVAHLARAIDDDEDIAAARHIAVEEHQIVNDAAFVIEQQAVALLAGCQVDHIDRHQGFKRGGGVRADQPQLAHVRHVEQAGAAAGVQVFGHQSGRVLHRHGIAGKRHHARTEFYMQAIERCFE